MGSTHKTIYFPDLMSIRIPLPPLGEQEVAVNRIREAATRSRSLKVALGTMETLLAERKRSLITAAVTGQFDVSSASQRAIAAVLAGAGGAG